MMQLRMIVLILSVLCIVGVTPSQAQCDPATPGDDTIECTDPVGGDIEGLEGDDTIIIDDTVNTGGGDVSGDNTGVDPGTGNDVIVNDGEVDSITGDSVDGDGSGNDNITNNGTANGGITGDSTDGDGSGNDNIVNNGNVEGTGISGDSAFGDGSGNDNITNNGTVDVVNGGITGDTAFGDGDGDDVIVNNGTVNGTGVTGDTGVGNGSGNDSITNNGTVNGGISGDTGAGDGSGNDTIVNNGTVNGDIVGDTLNGNSTGNDTIINNGTVTGDINANGGDDDVTIQGGSVGGIINGGDGVDSLTFEMQTGSESELSDWLAQLAASNPNGGTVTIGGQVYTWANFEDLVQLFSLRPVNSNAAPMQGFCRGNGDFEIYAISGNQGIFAFRVTAQDIANALASDEQPVQLGVSGDLSLFTLPSGEIQMNAPGYAFTFDYESLCGLLPEAEMLEEEEIEIETDEQTDLPILAIINRPAN